MNKSLNKKKDFCFILFCFVFWMRGITAYLYTERSNPIDTGKLTTEKLTIALLLSTKVTRVLASKCRDWFYDRSKQGQLIHNKRKGKLSIRYRRRWWEYVGFSSQSFDFFQKLDSKPSSEREEVEVWRDRRCAKPSRRMEWMTALGKWSRISGQN